MPQTRAYFSGCGDQTTGSSLHKCQTSVMEEWEHLWECCITNEQLMFHEDKWAQKSKRYQKQEKKKANQFLLRLFNIYWKDNTQTKKVCKKILFFLSQSHILKTYEKLTAHWSTLTPYYCSTINAGRNAQKIVCYNSTAVYLMSKNKLKA